MSDRLLEGKKTVKYFGLASGDAVLDIDIDDETIDANSSRLMVSSTAVVVERE